MFSCSGKLHHKYTIQINHGNGLIIDIIIFLFYLFLCFFLFYFWILFNISGFIK